MSFKPKLKIKGGKALEGEITIQGAKNSVLALASASILCRNGTVNLTNCPDLSDTASAAKIINSIGGKASFADNILTINAENCETEISEKLSKEMRSSFTFAGALLGRYGKCTLYSPGGDDIGTRPVNWHLDAFEKMGVKVEKQGDRISMSVISTLKGTNITLLFPSVGVTENIILAATLAKGTTTIKNAAREPEIVDLQNFLNKCGAKIKGAGESTITIDGVQKLTGCEYQVMPDRIVTATYMAAAAITKGQLLLCDTEIENLDSVIKVFQDMDCRVVAENNNIYISAPKILKSIPIIKTQPYPGFPTDCQAIVMAVLCLADGVSHFSEDIFDGRYKHAVQLMKMGADIKMLDKIAIITGVKELIGSDVVATDLRGGAALVLAALTATGSTEISEIHHIYRGYENLVPILSSVGAFISEV